MTSWHLLHLWSLLCRPCHLPQCCPVAVDSSGVQPLTQSCSLGGMSGQVPPPGLHHREIKAFLLDPWSSLVRMWCRYYELMSWDTCLLPRFIVNSPTVFPVLHNQHVLIPTSFGVWLFMSEWSPHLQRILSSFIFHTKLTKLNNLPQEGLSLYWSPRRVSLRCMCKVRLAGEAF